MTAPTVSLVDEIVAALATVSDPELDEPITDLGFVRSIILDDDGVAVHLRLPTSFCAPNFAYLMASDAQDVLRLVDGIGRVRVMLDDHHDSDKINAGLAADAGYRGTFGEEAEESLGALRRTFLRKAHTAAMERCVETHMKRSGMELGDLHQLTLGDLVPGKEKKALLRRRVEIGLSICPASRVFVDDEGRPLRAEDVPMRLRFAKSVRISMEGNAHFCRGLLATRYGDGSDTSTPEIIDTRTTRRP